MEDRTTFVIAHRLSTIQKADQILVVEDGGIVERGNHKELIKSKGRYYELYTYQTRI
jgi:subfamily B ATP-binding cassette protein MsbA